MADRKPEDRRAAEELARMAMALSNLLPSHERSAYGLLQDALEYVKAEGLNKPE